LNSDNLFFSEPTIGWTPPAEERSCNLLGYADIHAHLMTHLASGGRVFYGQPAPIDDTGEFSHDLDIRTAFDPVADAELHGDHVRPTLFNPNPDLPYDPIGNGTNDITADEPRHRGWPEFNSIPHWTSTTHQKMYYRWLERAYRGGLRLMVQLAVTNEALCMVQEGENCDESMDSIDQQIVATYDFENFIDKLVGGGVDNDEGWFRIVTDPLQARQVIADGKMAVVLGIEMDNLFNCKEQNDPDEDRPCPNVSPKTAGECLALEPDMQRELAEGSSLSDTVDWYHACFGIRHVFPIHNFDNAFGATATWGDAINVGQRASMGRWQNAPFTESASIAADPNDGCEDQGAEGYGFDFHRGLSGFIAGFGFGDLTPIPSWPAETICNTHGLNLTEGDRDPRGYGGVLLDALMNTGMIIDVDHMSIKSFNETVAFTRDRFAEAGYPLVASHVQSFEMHEQFYPGYPRIGLGRHERMRTQEQLEAIRDSGGMIAAMNKDDTQDTDTKGFQVQVPYPGLLVSQPIANDCRHSSKNYGQAYQYAVDTMRAPVAFGIDFNGIAGHTGPRFGSNGCGNLFDAEGQRDEVRDERSSQIRGPQLNGTESLVYPFTLDGFGTFERERSGTKAEDDPPGCFEDTCPPGLDCETECTDLRTWDFNVDGLAHVGLVPDLVEDLKVVGLGEPYLDALFGSAQEYIRVWERSEEVGTGKTPEYLDETEPAALSCALVALCFDEDETPPDITCPALRAEECTGQSPTRVFDVPEAEDVCSAVRSRRCDRQFFRLGSHTDTCSAVDTAGNEATCEREVTIFDGNVPSVTAPADPPPVECTSPSGASAELGDATASDLCDASPSISDDAPSVFPLGITTVTWTATDGSGNVSQALQSVTVVDTTPPTNTCPGDVTIECDESPEPSNTGEPTVIDSCDSAPEVASSDAEVAGACADESVVTRTWSATDAAGNPADDCDQTIQIVDTTAPVIACNAPATIVPPSSPISFTATAPDNCDPSASVEIVGFDCFSFTKKGKRIDKTEDGCVTAIDGDTFTILDSGGVDDTITWTVRATDRCGQVSETVCSVEVINPGDMP
jgi:microsomal dipeptidase-like Zn-dependent dipeptidase